jgi:hypothetical protein
VKAKQSLRLWIILFSALVLIGMCGLQEVAADPPPIPSPGEGNDSIRAVLKYLWPLLSIARKTGRVYYHAICLPDDHSYPLRLPKIDVQPPSSTGTALTDVRSMFRRDHDVTVTEDETGMVRVTIGEVPDAILKTRIARLSFDADSQFNLLSAIGAIESAPEVQSVMRELKVSVPSRVYHYALVRAADELPHLPAEISNVTMDRALDLVARTWGGVIFYGACTRPGTYEIFFADSTYFLGKKF